MEVHVHNCSFWVRFFLFFMAISWKHFYQMKFMPIYQVVQKMAQLLVGCNFKTTQQNYTKLKTTISWHVFNYIVNFLMQMDYKCRNESRLKIVCPKIRYHIVRTRNIECAQHALCIAYCCDKVVTNLTMVPNFHHYHCKYIWNWCIAL